jgi:hypothetical protein
MKIKNNKINAASRLAPCCAVVDENEPAKAANLIEHSDSEEV